MFSLFSNLRSRLNTSVGNRQDSDPLDVINTRRNLASLDRHSEDTQRPIIDQELDTSIREFQRDKGLKEDGLMNPGGETERALNRELSRVGEINAGRNNLFAPLLRLSAPVGNNNMNRNQDVRQVQSGLGGLGFASEAALFEPSGIIDRETIDGVKEFQRQNDLRIDGFLNPGGETEIAMNKALRMQASRNTDETPEGNEPSPPLPQNENDEEEEPDCSEEEAALEEAQAELHEAEVELSDAEAELVDVESRLEALREELRKLEEKKPPKPKKKPSPEIVAEIQKLEKDISTLEGLRNPIQKEIEALNEKIATLEEEKAALEKSMEGVDLEPFSLMPFFDGLPE